MENGVKSHARIALVRSKKRGSEFAPVGLFSLYQADLMQHHLLLLFIYAVLNDFKGVAWRQFR